MNNLLPIADYRDRIIEAVADHPVVIITAETGAGKSTQVPQYLRDAGYRVVVTQPRRMAARTVARRVADEVGTKLGQLVGFRTAEERNDSAATEVLFCTDGLQLVRELTGHRAGRQVLIIDEVHEWNRNIETLVAWCKHRQALGEELKVVLMSATIEAERLVEYFDGAPVITVPGRQFPVQTHQASDEELVSVTMSLARQGHNVLVFVPGKSEIDRTIEDLRILGVHEWAEILSLHGELIPDQQQQVFASYGRPKIIVSTNVAQTSVTIPDIDAVVDSGLERRTEVRDGVEGLYLGDISLADCRQRQGRAGRTKPGVYVLCSKTPIEERPPFPEAEIMRSRLDQLVLRLAAIGFDATALEFFHQPSVETLVEAKAALERLGALDDQGQVTTTGRAMSRLPVDVHYARMIVEAQRLGVLGEILTIVACLEVGGIRGKGKRVRGIQLAPQWQALTKETRSDLLAELDCYLAALSMSNDERFESDILVKQFRRAQEIRSRLARELEAPQEAVRESDHELVLKAVLAGWVDHLYRHDGGTEYVGFDGDLRQLDRNTVVRRAEWAIGQPFDLQLRDRHQRPYTLKLLTFASAVNPQWLEELASAELLAWIKGYVAEAIQINGVEVNIRRYKRMFYTTAVVSIPDGGLERVAAASMELTRALSSITSYSFQVVDPTDGASIVIGETLTELTERYRRHQIKKDLAWELDFLRVDCRELAAAGREVTDLERLIAEARSKIDGTTYAFDRVSVEEAKRSLARVKAEIDRLSQDPTTVLLDDLLAGRLAHPDEQFNQQVLRTLDAYAIRSGGFIESLTPDQLREVYRAKLGGAARADEVRALPIQLRLEDYAPADVLAELDLAPEAVQLEAKKGLSSYPVTYQYETIDGKSVAVGVIRVPLGTYQRNCASHGRRSTFPELPHQIRLIIEVANGDKLIARGEDGEALAGKVSRYEKSQKRSGKLPATDEFGLPRRAPIVADVPPPWHRGRVR